MRFTKCVGDCRLAEELGCAVGMRHCKLHEALGSHHIQSAADNTAGDSIISLFGFQIIAGVGVAKNETCFVFGRNGLAVSVR